MKIDIGSGGKILGTKRVSNNGQVSGFTEYAGREVLVILPGDETPVVRKDAKDILHEVETVVEEQMQLAFREYKNLRKKFETPENAARSFLERTTPKRLQGLLEKTDVWIKEQANAVEKGVRDRIDKSRRGKPKKASKKDDA